MKIRFRLPIDGDRPFIIKTWIDSCWYNGRWNESFTKTLFAIEYDKILNKNFDSFKVIVACDESDETFILGYIVFENLSAFDVFHYCHVRKEARELLQKKLFEKIKTKEKCFYSNLGFNKNLRELYKIIQYNPFLLWSKNE